MNTQSARALGLNALGQDVGAAPQGEVMQAVQKLRDELNQNERLLDELRERLEPVLKPRPEVVGEDCKATSAARLDGELNALAIRAGQQGALLRSLLQGLTL